MLLTQNDFSRILKNVDEKAWHMCGEEDYLLKMSLSWLFQGSFLTLNK